MHSAKSVQIQFDAMEYHADGRFYKKTYSYQGSEINGWEILRDNKHYLNLPSGYRLLKTQSCGICSTDIARAQLPFPLPQITGHEIVALDNGKPVVVEINASHFARGENSNCYYCNNNLANHCSDRLTLGIDRLPGGFAPYILAPKNSIIPLPKSLSPRLAVITEPLAAAIRALEKTPLEKCKSVAVLGPRRLGSLLLLALNHYRELNNWGFALSAIIRNPGLEKLCLAAGADEVLFADKLADKKFDVVFDTTGSISGLELSLDIAKDAIHLKSTNGQNFQGLEVLTEMVIDEISLHPLNIDELNSVTGEVLIDQRLSDQMNVDSVSFDSETRLIPRATNITGQYDAMVLADINDLNFLLRPEEGNSFLKPQGRIYLASFTTESKLQNKLVNEKIHLLTSRCGDFKKALSLLQEYFSIENFYDIFVTHTFNINKINDAFDSARNNASCIKAIIDY